MSTVKILIDNHYARSIHSHARRNKSLASNSLTDRRIQTSRPFIRLHHNMSTINQHQSGLNSQKRGTTRAIPQNGSFANKNKGRKITISYLKGSTRSRAREMIELI